MRSWLLSTTLVCLVSAGTTRCPGEQNTRFVDAGSPFFQYPGAWQTNGAGRYTIYPGSQVRFGLKGKARVAVRSGMPGTIRARVRSGEAMVWDGLLGPDDIEIDAGTDFARFSVVFLATDKKGFDPLLPDAKGAEFQFQGLTLDPDAALEPIPETRNAIRLDFIGDSITAGFDIAGRSGTWAENSDATLTYAFLLAEKVQAEYRIRAFPGSGCEDISGKFPFFQRGMALPANEQPDIVFVNVAANDRAKEASRYRAGMRNLLDVIFGTCPKTRVVLLNFFRMTPNRLPVLQELARSYPAGRVAWFDARPYLVGYADEGTHPDVESHRRLSEALADDVMRKLLPESPESGAGSGRAIDPQRDP